MRRINTSRMARHGSVIFGIDAAIKGLTDSKAQEDADKLVEASIRRIGTDAANNAPVDTGLMQSTLTSGIERSHVKPIGVWDLIQLTEYTLYQEYNNPRKPAFLRNAIRVEEPRFRQALIERFKKR